MPRRRVLGVAIALAFALASCGGDAMNQTAPEQLTQAPDSTAPSAPIVQAISGSQVDFADVLTQDTVLWFWAPW